MAAVRIGAVEVAGYEGAGLSKDEGKARADALGAALKSALGAAGYPEKADPSRINKPMVLMLLTILVIYVTMVYGPIAAWLVELFPTRIRYTSMSLPYHIGNGWFGGFLPTISFALVAASGNIYQGLWYPDHRRADDLRDRLAVPARDQGRGHYSVRQHTVTAAK